MFQIVGRSIQGISSNNQRAQESNGQGRPAERRQEEDRLFAAQNNEEWGNQRLAAAQNEIANYQEVNKILHGDLLAQKEKTQEAFDEVRAEEQGRSEDRRDYENALASERDEKELLKEERDFAQEQVRNLSARLRRSEADTQEYRRLSEEQSTGCGIIKLLLQKGVSLSSSIYDLLVGAVNAHR
jgi:DNA repair exonuclease SbcCD ATPase subunit